MTSEVIRIMGQIAGIGGLALGVALVLFREIIRKSIFPNLTRVQAYRLLRLIIVLIWTIAISGLLCWTYIAISSDNDPSAPSGQPTHDNMITIGAKNFLESSILLELMAAAIEHENPSLNIIRKHNLGETSHLFNALLDGEIDVYAEYTGTILAQHLKLDFIKVRSKAFHTRQRINELLDNHYKTHDIHFLEPFGVNNPFVLTMTKERAAELGIIGSNGEATISLLAVATTRYDVTFQSTVGFYERPDGYDGLVNVYDLRFAEHRAVRTHEVKYERLRAGEVDVIDGFATDPQLHLNDGEFIMLQDDKGFFPDYYAAPLIREDVLMSQSEVERALLKLKNKVNEREMAILISKAIDLGLNVDDLREEAASQQQLADLIRGYLSTKAIVE